MDMNGKFNKICRLTDKKELLEYIEKRFTTSFIGSLASVEDHFKELFTVEDWEYYWLPLREEILNKANAQKRLAVKELEKYEFKKLSNEKRQVDNYHSRNNIEINEERNFNQ